jgi:predicted ArsR family transcriptional regulator
MTRKAHVRTTTEQAIAVVGERLIASVSDVADALGCSPPSARRHLDGGVARGQLVRDEHDADGSPLTHEHWRYGIAPDRPVKS